MSRFVGALSIALLLAGMIPTSVGAQDKTKSSTGTVSAVAANSLTVKAASGEQKFLVDGDTKVVGQGAGTKTADGKVAFTDLVGVGDRVTVAYHEPAMHAAEVRVTAKAKK